MGKEAVLCPPSGVQGPQAGRATVWWGERAREEILSNRRSVEQDVVHLQEKLHASRLQTEEHERAARRRLVSFYKYGQIGYAIPLLARGESCDLFQNFHLVTRIVRCDSAIFARYREKAEETRKLASSLAGRSQDEERLWKPPESGDRDFAVAGVPSNSPIQAWIRRGEASPQAKDGLAGRREPGGPGRCPFAGMQRALPLPTEGEVKCTFGKTTNSSRRFLYNNGTIIVAPKGQPVGAVHDGVIVFADWVKEYGRVMIVDHGDHFFTLVAHLDRAFKGVGEPVQAGETIALVGDSGSTDGSKLYFEIRQGGRALDPRDWLSVFTTMRE